LLVAVVLLDPTVDNLGDALIQASHVVHISHTVVTQLFPVVVFIPVVEGADGLAVLLEVDVMAGVVAYLVLHTSSLPPSQVSTEMRMEIRFGLNHNFSSRIQAAPMSPVQLCYRGTASTPPPAARRQARHPRHSRRQ